MDNAIGHENDALYAARLANANKAAAEAVDVAQEDFDTRADTLEAELRRDFDAGMVQVAYLRTLGRIVRHETIETADGAKNKAREQFFKQR